MDPDYDYETYIKHKLKKPDEHYKSENLKKQRFNKKDDRERDVFHLSQ